ncbi:MAG: RtcB family protein [Actinomycetota bacterium]|nr:RtcB family protein [Actinomycetota bacterium]
MELQPHGASRWEIPRTGGMLVPGVVFASDTLIAQARKDRALDQVANVAHLPGIVGASYAMPDIHWGYGFPIGGVAATDVKRGGVVSPGGVGFDIGCGVRLLSSPLTEADFARYGNRVMARLDTRIPRGTGEGGIADPGLLDEILEHGARAVLDAGYGTEADLDRCEERGTSTGARPDLLSSKARQRGAVQLGSLGSGNHFLEIQVVDEIHDAAAAEAFGLRLGTLTVMIHCGSRGLGHQTCQDHLKTMDAAMARHDIQIPDRQLACVPVESSEGRSYLGAMAAAANFSWANRHLLAHEAREAFASVLGTRPRNLGLNLVFDVAHNLAKLETHTVGGEERLLCVHRKGATRAFGPGHPDIPVDLRAVGQPVLVPGSMGTASWVMRGVANNPAFDSSAHGAGRLMSRGAARRHSTGAQVRREMEQAGIAIRSGSAKLLAEEAPYAYKDVDEVASVCEAAGLAARVARLRPLGVVKA